MRMPGEEPTDDDLRVDAELTRQELAETVAALSDEGRREDPGAARPRRSAPRRSRPAAPSW